MLGVSHGIPCAGKYGNIAQDQLAMESAQFRAGSTGVATVDAVRKTCIGGRWMYKLIPELQRCLENKHGHATFSIYLFSWLIIIC